MKRTLALVFAGCLIAATPALADSPQSLIKKWEKLNSACRGGHGDDPNTMKACDEREAIFAQLKNMGWCYKAKWRRC